MTFRRGGRIPQCQFTYNNDIIEIVNEYTYLGVPFTSTGLFKKAALYFKQKCVAAISSLWTTFFKGKIISWPAQLTLFKSIVRSTVLYGSHI
jgi:hypothetical protein